MSGTLTYANPDLLHDMFYGFVDYITIASLRDGNCSFAGIDTTFTANLSAFDGPVFAIANGHGFGSMVSDTLSLMPDANITLFTYPDYGHMDAIFATNHFAVVEQPLLQWLATDAFAP